MTARSVFEKLVQQALSREFTACSDRRHLERLLTRGITLPEYCLPGRLVQRLTPEERTVLADLRPEMTWYRQS